jgi:PPOX class probable FMN-dependent enzyme
MDVTTWLVTSEDRLRKTVGELPPRTRDKVKAALDEHSKRFVAASPYVCVGTADGQGRMDVSPRGDEVGFVKVLDSSTVVIPERPGNRLADTLTNLMKHPFIGLLFLIPGSPETLRINGRARVQDGPPELLDSMAARGRVPKLAIIVDIDEVFVHCGRAASRSRIWDHTVEWIDPRADLLIGDLIGMGSTPTKEFLAAYNCSDL